MSAPFPSDSLALRCLALRAIMDGRGVEAAVLSSPRSLAHYGGDAPGTGTGALMVVTAREALWVAAHAGNWTKTWAEAAQLLPEGCALGHESGAADGLAALAQVLKPRRMLCIGAEVARQIEEWKSQAPTGQTAGA